MRRARGIVEPAPTDAEPSQRIVWVLAVLVAVLDQVGRPVFAVWPKRDPEASWMIGLQLIRDRGIQYGADQVFTYGPWGFLEAPSGIDLSDLWLAGTFRLLAVMFLFVALTACCSARPWKLPVTVLVTVLMANCSQAGWILMLALVAGVAAQLSRSRTPTSTQVVFASALAALSFQIKFSEGALSMAVVGLLVLTTRKPRLWLAPGASFLVASLLLWSAAGQSLSNIREWLVLGTDIVGGYGEAMAFLEFTWIVWVMVAGIATALLAVGLARSLPMSARICLVGVVLFMSKAALSRADGAHLLPGYTGLVLVMFVTLGASVPLIVRVAVLPVTVLLAALLAVNLPIMPARDVSISAWPIDAMPGAHAERVDQARAQTITELAISQDVIDELKGHPVSIDPWEISAAWAHDLDWHPLPVFQNYSAYTRRLDERNAEALLADPDLRVLRVLGEYPDRQPWWETPAYTLALLCNFKPVASDADWTVLARGDDRCGEAVTMAKQRVSAGTEVVLPRSDQTVVAVRFAPEPRRWVDRVIGATGVQLNLLHATVDGETYRVPEQLAGGPLIVGAPSGESVLFDRESFNSISFDRGGELEIVEIPLLGRESE